MEPVLLYSLKQYYDIIENKNKLLNIINNNDISLRIIDWFVTNYSKKFNTIYEIKTADGIKVIDSESVNSESKRFNVYYSYKSQLKSYSKKKFDPFCRRNRIKFILKDKTEIITTEGQLNFFKWAINNLIIDYILKNYKEIENDMNSSYTHINKIKETTTRKKRHELSKSASRGLNTKKIDVIIDFN